MDHGNHDMPMGPKCSMHMLWNTQIIDTCIVFPQWHIHSNGAFVLSFFVVVALGMLYEYLRFLQKSLDKRTAASLAGKRKRHSGPPRLESEEDEPENAGLLTGKQLLAASNGITVPLIPRLARATLYGSTVFLSFFLMLVFMTYNAYLIIAVVVGAIAGHFLFQAEMNVNGTLGVYDKGLACH